MGRVDAVRETSAVLTAVVCTRNRAGPLDLCLGTLAAQEGAPPFEVVVVDNGSSDATPAVVARWKRDAPGLVRGVEEPQTGLSHARNTGLAASVTPIVAFLDDDARASAGWVAALANSYRHVPEAVAAGGPVTLVWPSGRPSWLSPALETWYSAVDLGPERRRLGVDEDLFGTNFSVRREAAMALGGFDPRLGRVGRRLRSGEEAELLDRMRVVGPVIYEPTACVEHAVLPDRLSRRWLLRRTWAGGRASAYLDPWGQGTPEWKGHLPSARACVRQATAGLGMAVREMIGGSRRGAALMEDLTKRAVELGAARELIGLVVRRAGRSSVASGEK